MTVCVVDACVMGPLIVPDEAGELSDDLLPILASGDVVVPTHWRLEIGNLARMAVRRKRLTEDQLATAFAMLADFPVIIDADTNRHAWTGNLRLAAKHDLTAYDGAYLELALRLKSPLITRDGRLAQAAKVEGVELIDL